MSLRDGWSRGYTPEALAQAGIGNLQELADDGLAKKCNYMRRRWKVAAPNIAPENVAELKAAHAAMKRLQEGK